MSELEALRRVFKGDLVTPSDDGYEKAIARWALNASRRAKVVAFVKDAEDASLAIKYASALKLPIAIRGGGHSSSGVSSAEDGLVIDLSRYMNTVEVDPARKVAKVGGGTIWETVDKTTIKCDLASVGGTVNDTGVGGLLLGGGYGWLSGAYGLVIDNLVEATLVTADGSIIHADSNVNADLFWGIRGGGCNFGVCTEFVLNLHDQRRTVFAGLMIFSGSALEALIKVINEWLTTQTTKEAILFGMKVSQNGEAGFIVYPFYNGSEEEGREAFKAYYDLKPHTDTCKEIPYEELNAIQNQFVPWGYNIYMKGVSQTLPKLDVIHKLIDYMRPIAKEDQLQVGVMLEYFGLGKISSIPPNATAFRRRDSQGNALALIKWNNDTPERSKLARNTAHKICDIVTAGEISPTESKNSGYGNYDGEENQPVDRVQRYFGENYPRLQKLKKEYDPNMLFSKWYPIQPAD